MNREENLIETGGAAAVVERPLNPDKFRVPHVTAGGERRAAVALKRLRTLWFNTGTLCNLTCRNCSVCW